MWQHLIAEVDFFTGILRPLHPLGEISHMAVTEFVDVDPMCFDASATRRKYDDALTGVQQDSNIAIVSHETLSSRPHHGKYYAPFVTQRLKDVFPKARLLLIFREQSRIIYSLYGEYVRNGGRNTFAKFLGTGAEPPGGLRSVSSASLNMIV